MYSLENVIQLYLNLSTASVFTAVADAIRTSLGPRGMDKMVGLIIHYLLWKQANSS